jgi:nucleoside-specific outer membrane channel protein Tsx
MNCAYQSVRQQLLALCILFVATGASAVGDPDLTSARKFLPNWWHSDMRLVRSWNEFREIRPTAKCASALRQSSSRSCARTSELEMHAIGVSGAGGHAF